MARRVSSGKSRGTVVQSRCALAGSEPAGKFRPRSSPPTKRPGATPLSQSMKRSRRDTANTARHRLTLFLEGLRPACAEAPVAERALFEDQQTDCQNP